MKILLALCLALTVLDLRAADWTADYAVLLKKYVISDGVRYGAWKKNGEDMTAMQRVVDGIAASKQSDLPFYINAYNAWILHEALGKYPTKSVKDPVFAFFLSDRIKVDGEKMSFNHLEKDLIRARFKEPRVHFALNCASRSCPPLLAEPFEKKKLDSQFEMLAKNFVNSDRGARVTKNGVELSKIFDWYKEDFGGTPKVIEFINKRRAQPLPAGAKISYQDYNWKLNEAK